MEPNGHEYTVFRVPMRPPIQKGCRVPTFRYSLDIPREQWKGLHQKFVWLKAEEIEAMMNIDELRKEVYSNSLWERFMLKLSSNFRWMKEKQWEEIYNCEFDEISKTYRIFRDIVIKDCPEELKAKLLSHDDVKEIEIDPEIHNFKPF